MSSKKIAILQLVIALFFAGLILTIGAFVSDQALQSFLTYLLIAVWFVPFTFLGATESKRKNRKCGF